MFWSKRNYICLEYWVRYALNMSTFNFTGRIVDVKFFSLILPSCQFPYKGNKMNIVASRRDRIVYISTFRTGRACHPIRIYNGLQEAVENDDLATHLKFNEEGTFRLSGNMKRHHVRVWT